MGQGPAARGKRVTKKSIRSTNSLAKTSRKDRSERAGSFQMKARRNEIIGDEGPKQVEPDRYIRTKAGVVNFGGELLVDISELAPEGRREVLAIIENEAERATGRDAENRILKVTKKGRSLVVHTAKNYLAVALGKKLHRSRKGGALTVTWSDHDLPVRVVWLPFGTA